MKLNIFLVPLLLFGLIACAEEEDAFDDVFFDQEGLSVQIIGDSLFDFHVAEEQSIGHHLEEALGIDVIDNAIGGAQLSEDARVISDQYVAGDWDWLVMDGGGNDVNSLCNCDACAEVIDELISADSTTGIIPDFVNERTAEDIHVAYLGYYEAPATGEFRNCNDENALLKQRISQLADENPLLWLVDAADVVSPDNMTYFDDDHVHVSPLGAEQIGNLIADTIRSAE